MYLLLTVCSRCDHVFVADCVQLVWLCVYCWLCSQCDHVFVVDCVQLVWPCVCYWLCAVDVTLYLLLTVCSVCWLCAVGVTVSMCLLLTVCSRCVHVLTTGEGLIIQKNSKTEDGLMNVFATNVFGHYVLVSLYLLEAKFIHGLRKVGCLTLAVFFNAVLFSPWTVHVIVWLQSSNCAWMRHSGWAWDSSAVRHFADAFTSNFAALGPLVGSSS